MRIRVRHGRPAIHEPRDHLEGRRFARVADAALVRDAERQDAGAVETAPPAIQGFAHEVDDVLRHGPVDLVGQMDEARLVAVQAHPPREVRGIHADAVPTDPRSRIERHEAEGLGRGGLDDLARAHAELAQT